MGLFQDSDFAGDLEDSKPTSDGTLCIFGSHTFVPISWMCKKRTSVLHSSTESEIISLDAGLRMDGVPALDLWDLIVTVLHGNTNQSKLVRGNLSSSLTRNSIPGKFDDLNNVDFVSSNADYSRQEAFLYIFEDNETVTKMIINGGSPTMRHLLCLFNISHSSSINSVKAMSKRTPENAGEERVTAKSRPMTNLVSRCRARDPLVLASTASENPGNTKADSQKVSLSSLSMQQTGVTMASSSNSSEWNIDDKWSSQVRKSGEMSTTSTVKSVSNKLVVDIDMNSDTAAESNLSLKSRSFLHRVNDRVRKMFARH